MYLIPVIIKMPNSLFSPIFPHFTLNLYPSAKLFVSWLTANPRADTQYSNCSKSLKQPKSVYEAMIIRWNLLPLPVRWLQIIVLLGRYHYWSLVSPPFFWQDVTWSLCVFLRLQSQRLNSKLSEELWALEEPCVLIRSCHLKRFPSYLNTMGGYPVEID